VTELAAFRLHCIDIAHKLGCPWVPFDDLCPQFLHLLSTLTFDW